MIIILSSVVAAAAVTTVFVVSGKRHSGNNTGVERLEEAGGGEEPGEASSDEVAEEDIVTIVETATEDTKVESTEDTVVLGEKEDAKQGYLNRCVFLGDSRTVAMVNYGFFNDDAALAQIGISHPSFAKNTFINNAGKEYTLSSYLLSHQAPVIYIALGVNGINDPSEEHYKTTFLELIDKVAELAPNSNIVLMAIGPVDDNGTYKKTVQNSWIDKYNDFLLETAKDKHIFYLDIAEILKGYDGQVKSEYNAGDGLHYSSSGCEAIFNYIVSHPVPGIADDGEYVVKYIKPNPNRTKVTMDDGSGIDQDKLKDLMNMMMEGDQAKTVGKTSSSSTNDQEQQRLKAQEEERLREEERRKEEERKEEERRRKEEASKAAAEEASRQAAAEETRRRQAAEEASRQAEQSGGGQSQPSGGNESPSQPSEQQPEQPSESQPEPSPEPSEESPSEDNSSGEG